VVVGLVCQGWEKAFLLFKARQVADQEGSGAVAVVTVEEDEDEEDEAEEEEGKARGEKKRRLMEATSEERGKRAALLEFAVHGLKGDLFPGLLDFM
jgi:hypothetical protein